MIRAGRLRDLVQIESDRASADSAPDWQPIADGRCWAGIEATSGGERLRGQQIEAGVTTLVTLRYRPDVTSRMSIVPLREPARRLNIVKAVDPDGRREELMCQCQEVA